MTLLLVAAAGGLGAACRFAVDTLLRARTSPRYPVGTLVINVSGSLLLGVVAGLAVGGLLPDAVQQGVSAGFLGGYTTFSTAAVEAVRLMQDRRTWPAALASVGMLLLAVAAAAVGLAIGSAVAA
ncbi:CrcB family protein [Naasia sp. SYSU D00057]|uniref:fluoride efflux transporter FluC n=1 Tax=Naasia sp. SYSU D00057 TaxID=2817380 RepID=UPI001B316F70|nr:CrcB family protein [Naasia sp. SYSU D00057]